MAKPVNQLTTRRSAVTVRHFQCCRLLVVFTEGRDLCSYVGQGELCLKCVRSGEQGNLVCWTVSAGFVVVDNDPIELYWTILVSLMVDELQPQCAEL